MKEIRIRRGKGPDGKRVEQVKVVERKPDMPKQPEVEPEVDQGLPPVKARPPKLRF